MPEYIYFCRDLKKKYDDKEVLKNVTLAFYYGAKIGVIGHNGSGKSTLMRIMAGVDKEWDGEARLQDGKTVGYVPQEPWLDPNKTVLGNVEEAVKPIRDLLAQYDEVNHKLAEDMSPAEMDKLLDRQQRLQDEIEAKNAWELDHQLELAMHALGCPPPDADVTKISGGERRRVALCRTLLSQPDLLLLDEPTNHLDAATVAWLEAHLKEYKGTVILVTHDRYFRDTVGGWMLAMDRGRAVPYEGNYTSYLEAKRKRLELEEKTELLKTKTLARELEWIKQSPKARVAKNKARIANYERLTSEQEEKVDNSVELTLPPAPHLGERVVVFDKVCKSLGGKKLITDLTFRMPPGGVLGVIGPNGAGKTTFLKLITGAEKPDSGKVDVGPTVQLCYVDQLRDGLDPNLTVFQQITGNQEQLKFGSRWVSGRAYVSKFNFRGTDQQLKVGDLSGGQRNRVQLASLLRRGGNLYMLDEPTNDLDLETLRVLEEALQGYTGSLIIVTHDRYFLNRIATHVLAFDGEGGTRYFEGDFSIYEERIAAEREAEGTGQSGGADKYRKFTR